MALSASIGAVASQVFQKIFQCAIGSIFVGKPRQTIPARPRAKRAIEADDDIRIGRQRVSHRVEQKQNIWTKSSRFLLPLESAISDMMDRRSRWNKVVLLSRRDLQVKAHVFFDWLKRSTEAPIAAARDAEMLISQYGDEAYRVVRARALEARTSRIVDSYRDERHWDRVRAQIARRQRRSKVDTATRMLDDRT